LFNVARDVPGEQRGNLRVKVLDTWKPLSSALVTARDSKLCKGCGTVPRASTRRGVTFWVARDVPGEIRRGEKVDTRRGVKVMEAWSQFTARESMLQKGLNL
jgi:hypothetical protein